MATNECTSPIAIDFAPSGSSCEWCGQMAEYELTAIGGAYHNMSALFCRSCGTVFISSVTSAHDLDALVATKRGEVAHPTHSEYAAPADVPGDERAARSIVSYEKGGAVCSSVSWFR